MSCWKLTAAERTWLCAILDVNYTAPDRHAAVARIVASIEEAAACEGAQFTQSTGSKA